MPHSTENTLAWQLCGLLGFILPYTFTHRQALGCRDLMGDPRLFCHKTHSLQSEVGKSGCDTPSAPTTFPFHARQIGDVLTAARAAKGCFPVWTRSAPSCRSSVSFMGMKMSSSPPPLNRQQVMDCEGTGRCAWSGGCGCQPQQSSFTRQHQGMPPRAPWPVEAGEGACSSPALTPGQGRHLWCGNCRAPCVSFLDNPAVLPTKQVSTSCTAVAPAPEEDHCRWDSGLPLHPTPGLQWVFCSGGC